MRIAACYKCVPFAEEIGVNKDRTVDLKCASWEIGEYDLLGVETAMRLAVNGDSVVALTAGGEALTNSKMKKAILSRGPDEMVGVQCDAPEAMDSFSTAAHLKAGIEKLGDVGLVVCGVGSSDIYAQQVGNILGAMLGWSTVNAVSAAERGDGVLKVERTTGEGIEVLEVALPAVISVTSDICRARIATMKDIMGAGKKPATLWQAAELGIEVQPLSKTESLLAPETQERKRMIFEGTDEETVDKFLQLVKNVL